MKTFTTILGSLAVMLAGTFGLAGTTALAQEHTHEDHATTEGQQAQGSEAAESMDGMEGMDHSSMDVSHMPEPMQEMMGDMDSMMQNMPMESSGSVDADFLLMMIPHHQSAVDMAQVELEQGQDEETKAMAQHIIDGQQKEIDEMRALLERMGINAPAQ